MKPYIKFLLILLTAILLNSCDKKDEKTTTQSDDLKKKELELKEKELQLKEKEMMDKKDSELKEREKRLNQKEIQQKINLSGIYQGTIKDGTSWLVSIINFDGNKLNGFNEVYWRSSPGGYRTNFTGTYDNSSGEIIMYEDKNTKGSGKFIGKVSKYGNKMSGTWYRYS